jgi:hypothetical protein
MLRRQILLVALGLAGQAVAAPAMARVEAGSGYTKTQTFSAALRFLRVDRGYEIVEKDADAAYLLFRYPLPGRKESASGSLEVVETQAGVKVYVQLPRLPEYHESVLRDGLLRKLREEYGEPKKAPAPAKPPPAKPSESEGKPNSAS